MVKVAWLAALVLNPSSGFSFDLGVNMGNPSQQSRTFRYSGIFQPKTESSYQSNSVDTEIRQDNLSLSIPTLREEKHGVVFTSSYQKLDFETRQPSLPDLYSIQFGGVYTRLLEDRRILSFSFGYGSASDKPFESSNVSTTSASAYYSFPSGDTGTWSLIVNYSNNRPIFNNIPLPGFAYTYVPSRTFRGTFGAPFTSIYWQFAERWNLVASLVAPWVIKTSLMHLLTEKRQVYMGLETSQATYLQFGRRNEKERIYDDEKRAFVGFKSPISKFISGEIEGGYSFDRKVFLAEAYTFSPSDSTGIKSMWYGKLTITALF